MDHRKIERLQVKRSRRLSTLTRFQLTCGAIILFLSSHAYQAEPIVKSLTKAQLFEQAFGVPQPNYYEQETLLVFINGEPVTSAEFEVNPLTSDIKIKANSVAEIMHDATKEGVDLKLSNFIQANGYFDLDIMRSEGFAFTVSRLNKNLKILLPLAVRKRQSLSGSTYSFDKGRLYEPVAATSGYINMFNYNSYSDDNNVAQTYQNLVFFESNIQHDRWNFQHEGFYTNVSDRGKKWTNAALRAIYTQPEQARHFIVGEQSPLNTNWQLNPSPLATGFEDQLVGIGVNKRSELNDFANISNSFYYDFNLEEPAEIQVFVNDDLVYQKSLQQGVYKLKDLQLDDGSNDIRIVIIKESGLIEEFSDSYFQSFDILETGQIEYQLSSGYLYRDERDISNLDQDNLTNLLYARYGISQQLTLGAYLQHQTERRIGGVILQTSNRFGLWSVDFSHSTDSTIGSDYAARIELISNAIFTAMVLLLKVMVKAILVIQVG